MTQQIDGRRTRRRLTVAQFQGCLLLVQDILKAERIEAARAVLVDGDSQSEVAARYSWTRQAVNNCVQKLWLAHETFQMAKRLEAETAAKSLPPGWVQTTVVAPRRMLDRFMMEVDELKPTRRVTRAKK